MGNLQVHVKKCRCAWYIYRDSKIDILRYSSIPEPPTLIPQVLPNKEQQLHQQSDLKSLLKKPYVTQS